MARPKRPTQPNVATAPPATPSRAPVPSQPAAVGHMPVEDRGATAALRRKIAEVMRDRTLSPQARVRQREELLRLVKHRNPGNHNFRNLYENKGRPQDASEFVGELLNAAAGDNSQLFEQNFAQQGGITYETGRQEASTLVQLSIPGGAQLSVTDLFRYQEQFRASDTVGVETKSKSICAPTAQELCISLKRFNEDGSKNSAPVRLDNIEVEATDGSRRRFEPTAFIVHSGAGLDNGHYFSYVKERRGWVCYDDDATPRIVPQAEMEETLRSGSVRGRGQAYMVKYSSLDAPKPALPAPQNGTVNFDRVHGNRCWANAAMSFMSSFTSLGLERELEADRQPERPERAAPARATVSAPARAAAPLRSQPTSQPARRRRVGFREDDEVHAIDAEAPANHHLSATRDPSRPASRAAVISPPPTARRTATTPSPTTPLASRPVATRPPSPPETAEEPAVDTRPARPIFADMHDRFLAKKEAERKARVDLVKITSAGVAEIKVGDGLLKLEKDNLRWTSELNSDGTIRIKINEDKFKAELMEYYKGNIDVPRTAIKLLIVKALAADRDQNTGRGVGG